MSSRRAVLLAVLSGALLAACGKTDAPGSGATFQAVDITGATYASTLALPDADGRPRTLADWKGRVVVLFFGYAQCPDVCPTTLAEIAEVKRALGAEGDKVQGVFVTLDPERDTPELLKAYVGNFDPGFVALRGTPEQTQAAAKEFKIYFNKVKGKTEGSYTLDHTAGAFVFDARGQVRLFTRYGAGVPALVADIRQLLAQG